MLKKYLKKNNKKLMAYDIIFLKHNLWKISNISSVLDNCIFLYSAVLKTSLINIGFDKRKENMWLSCETLLNYLLKQQQDDEVAGVCHFSCLCHLFGN